MSNYDKITVKDGKVNISFALFKNDKRESENHPNAKSWDKENQIGAAAWTRKSNTGVVYQSCSIDIPLEVLMKAIGGQGEPVQNAVPQPKFIDDNEDIPF